MELTKATPASTTPPPASPAAPVSPPKAVNDVSAPQPAPVKPTDFVVHEPTTPADEPTPEQAETAQKKVKAPKPTKSKVEKPKSPGAGGAIFAAVVIILGLGAMFTYAYLRSQNISLF